MHSIASYRDSSVTGLAHDSLVQYDRIDDRLKAPLYQLYERRLLADEYKID